MRKYCCIMGVWVDSSDEPVCTSMVIFLRDQSIAGNCEMMIECERYPDASPLHDHEAGGVYRGQLMQIGAPEVFPALLQIAQVARKYLYRTALVDRRFP